MRQLKGGKKKETRKEKQERREDNLKIQSQLKSLVLPILGVIAFAIVVFVLVRSRSVPSPYTPTPTES